MPRFPVIPTIVVALAIAAMIALGVWQLDRRAEKHAALAQFAANLDKPVLAFPGTAAGDAYLFRRATAACPSPTGWRSQGGRSASGTNGWRQIATCRAEAGQPPLLVDMGVSPDPGFKPAWQGGPVTGTITHAPNHQPLLAAMFGKAAPRTLMLVSDTAAPGLAPTARPDVSSVPNNHLAYAVQWFLFAGVAGIIYVLALRLRARRGRVG
ncbi:SURF1 family protein [Sphingomonas sp. CJ20]